MSRPNTHTLSSVLICCSGGIDSSALIHYYSRQHLAVTAILFDYGQSAYQEESKALDAIAHFYNTRVLREGLRPALTSPNKKNGELIGRNAIFILAALGYVGKSNSMISLGIHAGPPAYYDCSPRFVQHMQYLLDGYLAGAIVLDMPWLNFHKNDIVAWARTEGVPLDLTYSCQAGSAPPCGKCLSCLERKAYGL